MPFTTAAQRLAATPDDLLVDGVRAGEPECFAELYRRHQQLAVGVALQAGIGRQDADDVVAEAFAKVLRALRSGLGPTENFRGYLTLAVRRVAWAAQADSSRYRPTDDQVLLEGAGQTTVPESLDGSPAGDALAALPHDAQILLWRTAVDGDQVSEIARELGKTSNSVAAAASRARSRLRSEYARRVAS
ncbi:MAG: sigma-70 family RNA polymerase sigma factor [Microbacterium sp.]|nr:MAG: sigma-70 family RNA polymerase sigma factor [Microbacterium sp.]